MFAGGRRRSSNNVRAMQLFHELKQQFPTIPDHVVSACISSNDQKPADLLLREVLNAAATLEQELMGHTPLDNTESVLPPFLTSNTAQHTEPTQKLYKLKNKTEQNSQNERAIDDNTQTSATRIKNTAKSSNLRHINFAERIRSDMNPSESDLNRNFENVKPQYCEPKKPLKRPDTLELNRESSNSSCKIRQSDKCKDVHKLLNSQKPPRSPITSKRAPPKPINQRLAQNRRSPINEHLSAINKTETSDPQISETKPQTVETPTQTTDTLLSPPGVNVSLNVNVDLVSPKCSSALHVVPQQPWCHDLVSPRSYTSVNLTLRPPSSEPQAPIDITSQNSSLTYSTSSFDSQKGLQSRLQITVSPTGGSISSMRTRPLSYHQEEELDSRLTHRVASLPDISTSPVLMKQQMRIDKLRIELKSEKTRLVAIQSQVIKLEKSGSTAITDPADDELEKQLLKEIRHLRGQCERLTIEVDRETKTAVPLGETNEEFYRNIYTGQRGPADFGRPLDPMGRLQPNLLHPDNYPWSCPMCTFQNHPLLDKCEQCEMVRSVHGKNHTQDSTNQILLDLLNVRRDTNQQQIAHAANSLLNYVTSDDYSSDSVQEPDETVLMEKFQSLNANANKSTA